MYILSNDIEFPPVDLSDERGFLAIGGDLSQERLLLAYRSGIFPWYNEEDPICWWSPDPRCVLYPANIRISKSMKKVISSGQFTFKINTSFESIVRCCKEVKRKDGYGSWIQEEIVEAYTKLFFSGFACCAEAWLGDKLVGGLYGVKIGKVFFGESMFSTVSNASKFAFIKFVELLVSEGVRLIDCQQQTTHLESLGAEMIGRELFINELERYC